MDPVNKSESEVSLEGRQIDGCKGVNAICLGNEGNMSGVQGMSDEAFIEETNSLCNMLSVPLGGVSNVVLSIDGPNDLNVIGQELGLDQIEGLGTQCLEGIGVGLEKNEEVENLISEGNEVGSNENGLLRPDMEIQKALGIEFLLSKLKRKFSKLDTGYRAHNEGESEKGQGSKKIERKGASRFDGSIANLLILDSGISNRRRVILKEAKKTWEADVELCGRRFIVVAGKWLLEEKETVLINVYTPNSLADQRNLWEGISGLRNQFSRAWIIG
ncbi:hypothetical protein J1N35_045649 [Gossypium stocksii]|uniref:Uncharacterized protein n=1 Tax=Gossypium stocksii TaxID=47602 RepID=A0A9D3UBQ8_9ROSI|nr:hypothetical protein J1N35_045649 [Gossypium stocksii]